MLRMAASDNLERTTSILTFVGVRLTITATSVNDVQIGLNQELTVNDLGQIRHDCSKSVRGLTLAI